MSLYNVNVEKSKRSLEVRNEVIEMIKDKFDINLGFWYNDLYKVKDGVCRRLKGGMRNVDFRFNDNDEFNEMFNKVKEFIDNLDIEEFDIKKDVIKQYYCYEGECKTYKTMNLPMKTIYAPFYDYY